MLAGQLHGFDDYRIEAVPDPVATGDDVVLDVVCVQPSVTEAMLIQGDNIALHDTLATRLRTRAPFQFGGHEFGAVVREVGPTAKGWRVGDRVTAAETVRCGHCPSCRSRRGSVCAHPEFLGFTTAGAFAEAVVVPTDNLVALPDGVTPGQAAGLQPLVGAIHAQSVANIRPGESVLVIGTGVMGLLAVQLARRCGAGMVAATGRSVAKREHAARLGADVVVDPTQDGLEQWTDDATEGVGFDVVIETAGGSPSAGLSGSSTLRDAVRCARYGGRIVIVSVLPDDASVPLAEIRAKALALLHPASGRTCHGSAVDAFDLAVRYVARKDIDVDSFVTHRLEGLRELPRALEMTLHKRDHGVINPPQIHLRPGW